MGYGISFRDSSLAISKDNLGPALDALIAHDPEIFTGASDLSDALQSIDWELDYKHNWIGFTGDRYRESHERAFAVIAPFVESGSYIEMVGQEGEIWRWVFDNGCLYEQEAVIAWSGKRSEIKPPTNPLTGAQNQIFDR